MLFIISFHSFCPSIYLFSMSQLAFHYSPAWEIISRICLLPVVILYIAISYAIWVSWRRDSPVNIHTSNIVNWYRNRLAITISSHILLFGHGRRLNSTVSNHTNNRKFGWIRRWFWKYLFHMQYDHEGVEITLSKTIPKHGQLITE